MNVCFRAVPLVALLSLAGAASAETLLIDRVHHEATAAMPTRGMTMDQVQARFGAPTSRLAPRGGQKHQWPTINRWNYAGFTVYFEKDKVVDAVATSTGADEIGPKPPIR
jgi:outer membrane protein assembly factor BamE (lipoprotein component of BamABCDE complex)